MYKLKKNYARLLKMDKRNRETTAGDFMESKQT